MPEPENNDDRNCNYKDSRILVTGGGIDGRVVSSFIVQALNVDPITVFGDGAQSRSFCYVDDLVGAITRLMLTGGDCEGAAELGAEGRARRWSEGDHRLFQALARTVIGRTAPISFQSPRTAARCP
jgi:nucleoside-diphosphate-sugar epimerase